MANRLTKIISGLDFLDKDENKRQRDQFAREDDEERKRKQRAAAARVQSGTALRPGTVIQPGDQPMNTTPKATAGSQSDSSAVPLYDPSKPLVRVKPAASDELVAGGPQEDAKPKSFKERLNAVASGTKNLGVGLAKSIGNDAKAGYQTLEGTGAATVELGRAITGRVTGNKDAEMAAVNRANRNIKKVTDAGIISEEGAEGGLTSKAGLKDTLKGALRYGQYVAPEAKAAAGATTLRKVAVAGASGAATNTALEAGNQLLEDGKLNLRSLGESAVLGAALGSGGAAIGDKITTRKLGKAGITAAKEISDPRLATVGATVGAGIKSITDKSADAGRRLIEAEESAAVPGRANAGRKESESQAVEIAPGVKSTNMNKPEPTRVTNEQGASIDRDTDLKIGELMDASAGTPVEPGMKRLYQGTENGVPTDWNFDNVDDLARYYSDRAGNVDFDYQDVPVDQAIQQTRRGEGVYRVEDPKPKSSMRMFDYNEEPLTPAESAALRELDGNQLSTDYQAASNELRQLANESGQPELYKKVMGQVSDQGMGQSEALDYISEGLAQMRNSGTIAKIKNGGVTPGTPDQAGINTLVKDYGDMLQQMDSGVTGGNMVPNFEDGGYTRTSEHSPFYRQFYAENGRAPSGRDFQAEALRQLQTGKADSMAQEEYAGLIGSSANDIPDPADPRALARIDAEAAPRELDLSPIADFTDAMNVPLKPINRTAEGNVALQSDASAIAAGDLQVAPTPSVNPTVTVNEQMAADAARISEEQVQGVSPAAPRTYDRLMQQIEDPTLRNQLSNEIPGFQSINIADQQAAAREIIGGMDNQQLIQQFKNGVDISTPEGFFQALPIINRLGRTDVLQAFPEAAEVLDRITSQVALRKSTGGQILRSSQVLFENMPPVLKRDALLKSLGKAGEDMQDGDRELFLRMIERSDEAEHGKFDPNTGELIKPGTQQIEDQATAIKDSLQNNPGGADVNALRQQYDEMQNQYDALEREAGSATADAVKFYEGFKPNGSIGGQAADIGRGLMLSGLGGRVFDNISTAATAVNDVAASNVSAGIGKVLNRITGNRGDVIDDSMSLRTIGKGFLEGGRDVADSFRGRGDKEASLESFNGGDPNRSGVGDTNKFTRFVNNVVDIPTKLTKGLETARAEQLAKQEAKQLGLDGDEGNLYAQFSKIAQDQQQKHEAVQFHMRTNNLHENGVTNLLNSVTSSISASRFGQDHPQFIGAMDTLIKNQVAPFTSFLGGNLNRALTDKNMLYNVVKATTELKKGNLQGFADQVSNLAVNGTQAMAVGYALSEAGILTDKDANGKDYGGVYLHVGDRYIPVAVLGASSVPIIFGQAAQSAIADNDNPGDSIADTAGRAVTNTLASAGVASVFGGENNLQQTVSNLSSNDGDSAADPLTKYGSSVLRQFVNPAIFGDINAAANNGLPFGLNPNAGGMAPQIDVTKENEDGRQVKDVGATESRRVLAGIPIVSQTLDRSTEKTAPDLLDRSLKSVRETGDMKQSRKKTESLEDVGKQLKKDKISTKDEDLTAYIADGKYDKAKRVLDYKIKEEQSKDDPSKSKIDKLKMQKRESDLNEREVPLTDDGIKARTEAGDYDAAIEGLQYQVDKTKGDKNVPESTRKQNQDDITRLKVAKDKKYDPKTIALYGKTANNEWRDMGDPQSDDYDPDTYALLAQYDADLAANGVSASTKDGSTQKFYNKGSRGGSGGASRKLSTSIATNDINFGKFTPIKEQAASGDSQKSSIPTLNKVANNDRSKLRKINVTRGA